ncbi:MAG: hypothetical protein JNK15_04950 [Planctomycetes bacterium]|nr:hypothetical protein [Planctomycetota bacterium]
MTVRQQMESANGSHELTRLLAAYLTSIAFGVTFLVAWLAGVDGSTALWRSVAAAGIALVVGQLLARPVVGTVLDAIARDEAKKKAEAQAKEDA